MTTWTPHAAGDRHLTRPLVLLRHLALHRLAVARDASPAPVEPSRPRLPDPPSRGRALGLGLAACLLAAVVTGLLVGEALTRVLELVLDHLVL